MQLKCSFEIVDLGDESIAVPVGSNAQSVQGVFKLNKEGAEIFRLFDVCKDETEIVDALMQKYDDDRSTLSAYVHKVVQELITTGTIE